MILERLFQARWQRWLERRIPPASRVRLDNRRVFILPSRVGLAFGVALILMLLAAINYQNSLAYGLTFLLGSVFIVTILHTYRNLAGLGLQAAGGAPVFLGEQACLRVRLQSEAREHRSVALGWPPQPLQWFDVAAQGACDCELSLPTRRRGWLRPGRLRVESCFPLGLLRAWSWVDLELKVLVYPKPVPGDLPLSSGHSDEEEEGQAARGRGVDDFQGLRDFQPGDSRRRLHWKAFSKGQGLLVKDFAALTGRDLCLDFEALGGDVEQRLSLLCHWVLELSRGERPFALRLPDAQLPADIGDAHRDACLRRLALYGLVE